MKSLRKKVVHLYRSRRFQRHPMDRMKATSHRGTLLVASIPGVRVARVIPHPSMRSKRPHPYRGSYESGSA